MKYYSPQEKLEYIAKNWEKKTIAEISAELHIHPTYVSSLARKIRENGGNIKKKPTGGKHVGSGIDWKAIKKLRS